MWKDGEAEIVSGRTLVESESVLAAPVELYGTLWSLTEKHRFLFLHLHLQQRQKGNRDLRSAEASRVHRFPFMNNTETTHE